MLGIQLGTMDLMYIWALLCTALATITTPGMVHTTIRVQLLMGLVCIIILGQDGDTVWE